MPYLSNLQLAYGKPVKRSSYAQALQEAFEAQAFRDRVEVVGMSLWEAGLLSFF